MSKLKKKEKSVPEHKKTESRFDISQETKNSIWGISAFILAIISVLSFVGKAGWAGEGFDLIARSLFGWGFFNCKKAIFAILLEYGYRYT